MANLKDMSYYRILLTKFYFEKGYAQTHYFFKLTAIFGLTTQLVKETFITLFLYSVSCYFLGKWWCKKELVHTENEIANIFNPFQIEVRQHLKNKTFK